MSDPEHMSMQRAYEILDSLDNEERDALRTYALRALGKIQRQYPEMRGVGAFAHVATFLLRHRG